MRDQNTILELVSYAAASAAALAVDVGVLTALVSGAGWPYLAGAVASFVAGGVFLYFVSTAFVFRFRRIPKRTLELPFFLALGLVGLPVNIAVMYIAVETAHVHYLIGKCGAAVCTFGVNFALRRTLMFSRDTRALPEAEPSDA
jgi:putative flippase GtrA